MTAPAHRLPRAGCRSATRLATPLCAVAARAFLAAGLPWGVSGMAGYFSAVGDVSGLTDRVSI
jgi:hypothetical protein